MKTFFKNYGPARSGETLVEVMVAVSMLALVVTPATNMYVNSLRITAGNRAQLVADGLAVEGIEMMRNIRDTNVLRFPQKKATCWDTIPAHTNQNDCENNRIASGPGAAGAAHVLNLNLATLDWSLLPGTQPQPMRLAQNPSPGTDAAYQLYLDEFSTLSPCPVGITTGCHTHFRDDSHLYTGNNLVNNPARAASTQPTDFYREIYVEHFDADSIVANGSELMKVTSTVRYRVGAAVKEVVRKAILSRPT